MRQPKIIDFELGTKEIKNIEIDFNSRYELMPVLEGLKYIYYNCEEILFLIMKDLTKGVSDKKGKKGMSAWRVLCFYVIRKSTAIDYANLEHMARYDEKVREILQVGTFEKFRPNEKTINNNILKLSSETIDKINEILTKKNIEQGFETGKKIRGDSFVCKVNMHFPTDNGLIYDCGKTMIRLSELINESGWRKGKYWLKKLKKQTLKIGKIRKSSLKKEKKKIVLAAAYNEMLKIINIIRSKSLSEKITGEYYYKLIEGKIKLENISPKYIDLIHLHLITNQVIDITYRRNIKNEVIKNSDKIFSIYEKHVELINRGKFPIAIEFGHRVMLNQGSSGLILNYKVMEKGETDEKVIKPLLKDLTENYGLKIDVGSYDKGFYFKNCYEDLSPFVNKIVIAKKGKPTKESKEREHDKHFIKNRLWRSGIESAISSLVRGNGLGLCPDKGYENYKKHIAGCVLARNLQTIGKILLEEKKKKLKKSA
jgi:IS5 family transposase